MPRNLDRRVEALAPVRDPALRGRLEEIVTTVLADTDLAWELDADGTWSRVPTPADDRRVNAQRELHRRATERAQRA
jgi:polyphosphate kinase